MKRKKGVQYKERHRNAIIIIMLTLYKYILHIHIYILHIQIHRTSFKVIEKAFTRNFTGYMRNVSTEDVGIEGMELFSNKFGLISTVSVLTYFNFF